MLGGQRKAVCPSDQVMSDKIRVVFSKLFLSRPINETDDHSVTGHPQQQSADAFDYRVRAFEQHAHLKQFVYPPFLHSFA